MKPVIMEDLTQHARKLKHPQVRVWSSPVKGGDAFYRTFKNVPSAYANLGAMLVDKKLMKKEIPEDVVMIAVGGFEMNLAGLAKKFPHKLKEVF